MVRLPPHRPLPAETFPLDRMAFGQHLRRSTATVLMALGVPLLLLVGLVLFLLDASQELDRSDRVIAESNQVEKLLVTMQATFRDYALATNPHLREVYRSARRNLEPPMQILAESVSKNPGQQKTWHQLESETRGWTRITDEAVARFERGESVERQRAALLAARTTYGAALAHAQGLIEEEERLRAIRNQAISRVVKAMMAVFILAAVVGVPILAWWIRALLERVNGHYRAGLEALQASEGRLRFLNELSDATGPLVDPTEIMRVTCRLLGRRLQATRCFYADVAAEGDRFRVMGDDAADGPSLAGEHRLDTLGAELALALREGRPVRIGDAASEFRAEGGIWREAWGGNAVFAYPLMKVGRLQALLVVIDHAARSWSDTDANLIGEVAERCRTIVDRVRAEADLRGARDALERANRAKDDFLATLSHELRTPLTPVLMAAAALREDDRLPRELHEQLVMMERNIALEARLIDDLLDLTKIARGRLELRVQPCDAHDLIRLAIEIVKPDALAKGIAIEPLLAAERSGLQVDPARFQQVIWNLLRNAVKFTPPGGRIAVCSRGARWPDGRLALQIEVADSGIGIEPEMLGRIFLPFEQGGLVGQHRLDGVGLGLTIARRVVELHGGRITAQSAGANRGATFLVEIPGAEAAPADPAPGLRPAAAGRAVTTRLAGPLRLLLVEDHQSTLQVLHRLLERDGHQVTPATTAAGALTVAASRTFDLVVSDLGLPDGSGLELMGRLRADYGLKGIALSGYGMEDDRNRSRAAGFVAHLVKPVNVGELRRVLADAAIHQVPAG